MQFCNKCGAKLTENSKFCDKCGTRIVDDENLEDENYIKEQNSKKKNTLPIIIVSVVLVIVFVGIAVFFMFLKDPLLYSYHYNKALNETSTNIKLTHYNKALRYEQNKELLKNIFITLKEDSEFENEINSLSNLNGNNKSKLIIDICTEKADFFVKSENYASALKFLKIAEKYNYDIKTYPKYEKIDNYLKEEEEKKNKKEKEKEQPKQNDVIINYRLPANIYSYSDDYIIYDSSYVYLTKQDLMGYSKEALALIRNEIYARHGYVFQTEPFKSYFNSKYWYTPNYYFSEYDLNKCERHNVDLILKMEKS